MHWRYNTEIYSWTYEKCKREPQISKTDIKLLVASTGKNESKVEDKYLDWDSPSNYPANFQTETVALLL